MISKYNYKGIVWINLDSPKEEEIELIKEQFDLPDNFCKKLKIQDFTPFCQMKDEYLFASASLPYISSNNDKKNFRKINIISGNNIILTNHSKQSDFVNKFLNDFEINISSNSEHPTINPDEILVDLLENFYKELDESLLKIKTFLTIKNLDKNVLLNINNYLVDIKKDIILQKDILYGLSKVINNNKLENIKLKLEKDVKTISIYLKILENIEERKIIVHQERQLLFLVALNIITFIILIIVIVYKLWL